MTLADATMCDPGSLISMVGQLGFEACGVQMWELDPNFKPKWTIGKCGDTVPPWNAPTVAPLYFLISLSEPLPGCSSLPVSFNN